MRCCSTCPQPRASITVLNIKCSLGLSPLVRETKPLSLGFTDRKGLGKHAALSQRARGSNVGFRRSIAAAAGPLNGCRPESISLPPTCCFFENVEDCCFLSGESRVRRHHPPDAFKCTAAVTPPWAGLCWRRVGATPCPRSARGFSRSCLRSATRPRFDF